VTIPAFLEIAIAVSILSPVHIITFIPAFLHNLIESTIDGLRGSWRPKIEMMVKSFSSTSLSLSLEKSLLDALIASNS